MLSGTPQGGVISPLLSNIYLHVLDAVWERTVRASGHAGALRGRLRRDVRDEGVRASEAERRVQVDPRAARSGAASGQDEASGSRAGHARASTSSAATCASA